jgi:hypothetical protein
VRKRSVASIAAGLARCGFISGAGSNIRIALAFDVTRHGLKWRALGSTSRISDGPVISHSVFLYRSAITRRWSRYPARTHLLLTE